MEWVLVERAFDAPAEYAQLEAQERRVAQCLAMYRVRPIRSYVSRDGRRMVCMYEAPDVESVRTTQRSAGLPFEHAYGCHRVVERAPERPTGYSLVVAQRAVPEGFTLEQIQHLASDPAGCNRRLRLEHFGGFLARDLSRMVCLYYSPDLESVRMANRETGTPYEHLWSGDAYDGDPGGAA